MIPTTFSSGDDRSEAAPTHEDLEKARLAALERYGIMDSEPESLYDDITQLASEICGTPISAISLLDDRRQWFKSSRGLTVTETRKEHAFCAHTIRQGGTLIVENALEDPRFAANPLVTHDPHIRFYAGSTLLTHDGYPLGSLCVIDSAPRHLEPGQISSLEKLSRLVMTQLELRRTSHELAAALKGTRTLKSLLPICAYCRELRDDQGYWKRLEVYVKENVGSDFSHGICPPCLEKHFPGFGPI